MDDRVHTYDCIQSRGREIQSKHVAFDKREAAVRWTGLEVLTTTGGTLLAAEGTVEFRAHSVVGGVAGAQHENSRFVREGGRWLYLDGVALA